MKVGDLVQIPFDGMRLACYQDELREHKFATGNKFVGKILYIDAEQYLLEFDAHLTSTWPASADHMTKYGCRNDRWYWFCDKSNLIVVGSEPLTLRSSSPTPLSCCECREVYPYAESNMSGGRLLCYSCRSTLRWKYPECKV